MKNFFKKMKSYSFWVSFSGALIILLNAFGRILGWQIENQIVEGCIMSIAGILVVFGVVTMDDGGDNGETPDENEEQNQSDEETKNGDSGENEDENVASEQ